MDCPFCPECNEYVERPRARVSLWAPLVLIAAVLVAASLAATSASDSRESSRATVAHSMSRAL